MYAVSSTANHREAVSNISGPIEIYAIPWIDLNKTS